MRRQQATNYLVRLFGSHTGYVALAAKATDQTEFHRQRFAWPTDKDTALDWAAAESAKGHNVFIIPALRDNDGEPRAGTAAHLGWLWAEIDWKLVPENRRDRTAAFVKEHATFSVRSGSTHDGRSNVHAYFKLSDEITADEHYALNTGLKEHLYADAKQSDASYLRLPGTFNRKGSDPVPVVMVRGTARAVSGGVLKTLKTDAVRRDRSSVGWERVPVLTRGRLARIARSRPGECKYAPTDSSDRSEAVWAMIGDLIKSGATKDEIHTLMDDAPMVAAIQADRPYDVHLDIEKRWVHDEVREPATPDKDELPTSQMIRLVKASSFRLKRVQWGWQDRMPVGELCLIPGREGSGKSMFLAWLAAQITTGKLPGVFYGQPRPIAYVANEDAWEYTIAPRMLAAGADLDLVYNVEVEESHLGLRLPQDCLAVGDLLRNVGAAALMLDPIVSVIDDSISVNQSRELRQALEPLRRMAERAQVMVPALAHFNKAAVDDVLSKIPGARAWAEVARAAIGIAQDEDEGHYVASQIKNNLGRLDHPHLTYTIESADVPTDDGVTSVGRLTWGEESERGVSELLDRRTDKRGREASDTTKRILTHVLASPGSLTVADVQGALSDIKPETITRTLGRLADKGDLVRTTRGMYGRPRFVSERD